MRPASAEEPRTDKRVALIVAAGDLPPATLLSGIIEGTSSVIVADGGLHHANLLDLEPDLIVGDMDSVDAALLAGYSRSKVERHSEDKAQIDLELALDAARRSGAKAARVLGAFGDRFDQGLAALLIAARLARGSEGFPVELHGGNHSAYPVTPGLSQRLGLPHGTVLSLLSVQGDAVVSVGGVRFPLNHAKLPFGTGLGVSNVVIADAVEVTCHEGTVALIVEHVETRA